MSYHSKPTYASIVKDIQINKPRFVSVSDASVGKMINFIASHVVTASFAGIISEQSREVVDHNIIPHLRTSGSGRLIKIEKFSHYVGNYYSFNFSAACVVSFSQ